MSAHRPMMPSTSADTATRACSSASALDRATVFCCRLYVLTTWSPRHMIPPLVLRAVRGQPAQSESVNPVAVPAGFCHL